MGLVWV